MAKTFKDVDDDGTLVVYCGAGTTLRGNAEEKIRDVFLFEPVSLLAGLLTWGETNVFTLQPITRAPRLILISSLGQV